MGSSISIYSIGFLKLHYKTDIDFVLWVLGVIFYTSLNIIGNGAQMNHFGITAYMIVAIIPVIVLSVRIIIREKEKELEN